ncbi:MAG: ATP-grasp domain-containing protein [Syntrophomonas sp.]
MNDQKLVIIGAGEFQIGLVETARRLGYETHVFAWEEGAVCRFIADHFYPISIVDKERILKNTRGIEPVGIVSIASDLAVPTVNYVANELGLVGNSNYSSLVSTNKYEMRKALSSRGISCSSFVLVDNEFGLDEVNMTYPLIVKPVDRSGSRGITKIIDERDLNSAIRTAITSSIKNQAILEEFFEGQEYSIEMISFQGVHYFLAITEKFTAGAPHFVEKMHLQPGRIKEYTLRKAIEIVKKALDALKIKNGASHSEIRINKDNEIMIIEIGARMGGDYIGSDLVKLTTGNDYLKMVIDIAVGKEPEFGLVNKSFGAALVRFIFNKEDLNIFQVIHKNHQDSLYKYDIKMITDHVVTDSSNRHGYFILHCRNAEECLHLVGEQ